MLRLLKRCVVFPALSLLICYVNGAYAAFMFNFTSVTCKNFQPSLYSHISCNIGCTTNQTGHATSSSTTLNFAFAMLRNAPDLYCQTIVAVDRHNGASSKIFDLPVNVCEFNRMNFAANFLRIFYRAMKRHINEFPQCPMKTNFTYIFKDLQFNPDDFPSYMPESTYKVQLNFMEHGKLVTYLHFDIDVIYKRNLWTKSKRKKT